MLKRIIDEIYRSLEDECFIAALSLALTIPDICGKAEYLTDNDTKRYIKWYNEYIGKYEKPSDPYGSDMPYLSGEMIYNLRCSMLHQGTPSVDTNRIKEQRCQVDQFVLSITDKYDSGTSMVAYGAGMQITKRKLTVNIVNICHKLCRVASSYYEDNQSRFDFFQYEIEDKRKRNQQYEY